MPHPPHVRPRQAAPARRPWRPVKQVALLACVGASFAQNARAQTPATAGNPPLVLQSSRMLADAIARTSRDSLPTYLSGDRLTSRTDLDTAIDGNAVLRRGDLVVRADQLTYSQPTDVAHARGNVRVNQAGNIYEGPELQLKVESFEGFFIRPTYALLKNAAHGEAEHVDFIDPARAVIRNATYTTCRRESGPSWMPAWLLRAASIRIDNEEEVGSAEQALLTFKGVPILPIPALSFPLSDKRKSGFLPPTIGLDNVNGLELTLPYYWNIAPNRDITLFPSVMSKRGIDLGGEFRYLERDYNGVLRGNFMPGDKLRNRNRWEYGLEHRGTVNTGLAGVGALGVYLNMNRASDDNYWRDFTREGAWLTQRLLPNDLRLDWGSGPFSIQVRMLKWQTLQDLSSPIVPPYDRAPQVTGRYARTNVGGFDYSVELDSTQFNSDKRLTGQPNARRAFGLARISRPWVAPAGFITPKLQLHATNYQFSDVLANGAGSASRVVPTFSLDAGLVFERDASFFGRAFRQTLEPRAFYVYTPYRDQRSLPNYDSGTNDFNFGSIYTENAFVGSDRIADANLVTVGVTSRLLDPETGGEAARFGVAQRLRFQDQRVTLGGGAVVPKGVSDVLLGATLNLDPRWAVDSMVQFNPDTRRSVRSVISGRYSPGDYRAISAAYRLQRGLSEQIDVGWQWPLNALWGGDKSPGNGEFEGRWYTVGRMNFSLREGKLVDSVVGFEYDGGCWLGRVVVEKLQTGTTSSKRRILFQLEFVGFSRLGSNALQSLKDNIPRYQYLREKVSTPSRFSRYE